ncbi:hypothetical protein [Micromonospora sp. NPDC005367]|uniref:hypothetical protein n=1 Tax=Micromonospora sp. NPDC005367 TaxID=3155590 RepID=UPI0033A81658
MENWSVLDRTSDPAPGSPEQVRALAERLRQQAELARRRGDRLRGVIADRARLRLWGDYAELLDGRLDPLPKEAALLGAAYGACATALLVYAQELDQLRIASRAALQRGIQAHEQYVSLLRAYAQHAPVPAGVGGQVWRGLDEAVAFRQCQALQEPLRQYLLGLGRSAGMCEFERKMARHTAAQIEYRHRDAANRCARAVLAAAPRPLGSSVGSAGQPPGASGPSQQVLDRLRGALRGDREALAAFDTVVEWIGAEGAAKRLEKMHAAGRLRERTLQLATSFKDRAAPTGERRDNVDVWLRNADTVGRKIDELERRFPNADIDGLKKDFRELRRDLDQMARDGSRYDEKRGGRVLTMEWEVDVALAHPDVRAVSIYVKGNGETRREIDIVGFRDGRFEWIDAKREPLIQLNDVEKHWEQLRGQMRAAENPDPRWPVFDNPRIILYPRNGTTTEAAEELQSRVGPGGHRPTVLGPWIEGGDR